MITDKNDKDNNNIPNNIINDKNENRNNSMNSLMIPIILIRRTIIIMVLMTLTGGTIIMIIGLIIVYMRGRQEFYVHQRVWHDYFEANIGYNSNISSIIPDSM